MNCLSKLTINLPFEGYFLERNESICRFLVASPGLKTIQKNPSYLFIHFYQVSRILILKMIKNSGCALDFNKINIIVFISTGWRNIQKENPPANVIFIRGDGQRHSKWYEEVSFSNFLMSNLINKLVSLYFMSSCQEKVNFKSKFIYSSESSWNIGMKWIFFRYQIEFWITIIILP